MKKLILASMIGVCLVLTFVSASSMHPLPFASPAPTEVSPYNPSSPVSHSGGGHMKCYTLWAWNGNEYVKQDVVVRQTMHKGIMVDNVMRGSQCRVMNKKPTTMSSDTIGYTKPLPFEWYKHNK